MKPPTHSVIIPEGRVWSVVFTYSRVFPTAGDLKALKVEPNWKFPKAEQPTRRLAKADAHRAHELVEAALVKMSESKLKGRRL